MASKSRGKGTVVNQRTRSKLKEEGFRIPASLEKTLKDKTLFESLYYLENHILSPLGNIGTDSLSQSESIQIEVMPQLGLSPNQIEQIETKEGKVTVECHFAGLTGAQSVLPQHYTDLVLERKKSGDHAMGDFFNVFNHRLLSLYYRAWLKNNPQYQLRASALGGSSAYADKLLAVTGTTQIQHLRYANLLARRVKSRRSLQSAFEDMSGCRVSIKDFLGQWVQLKPNEQTQLPSRESPQGQHATLGKGASMGKRAWDVNAGCCIEFTANSERQVREMLPNSKRHQLIVKLAPTLMGSTKKIKFQLSAKQKYLPKYCLGKCTTPLGVGGTLAHTPSTQDKTITITI